MGFGSVLGLGLSCGLQGDICGWVGERDGVVGSGVFVWWSVSGCMEVWGVV